MRWERGNAESQRSSEGCGIRDSIYIQHILAFSSSSLSSPSLPSPQLPRQTSTLKAEFERCNGYKDCLDRLVFELGGRWKKAHISRQLKTMLLVKGKLTGGQVSSRAPPGAVQVGKSQQRNLPAGMDARFSPACQCSTFVLLMPCMRHAAPPSHLHPQEERLREQYEELRGRPDCFEQLAEELGAGFTAQQVRSCTALHAVLSSVPALQRSAFLHGCVQGLLLLPPPPCRQNANVATVPVSGRRSSAG